jgi:predicted TIM-barrel fold metal-dependent hydrolase
LVASVHVQANCGAADPSDETDWLAEVSRSSGWPDAVVGGVDLSSETAGEVLALHGRYPLARGVRAMVAHDRTGRWRFADRPHVMQSPVFIKNAGSLSEMGFSLDLVVVPEQLTEVAQLAKALPELTIIVDHLATPEAESLPQWITGIEAVSDFENVALKLSGLWTIDKLWRTENLRPYVRHALAHLGGDRLMYGSNAPIETLHCPVIDQIRTLASLIAETDPQSIKAVFCETAMKNYRLQPKDPRQGC